MVPGLSASPMEWAKLTLQAAEPARAVFGTGAGLLERSHRFGLGLSSNKEPSPQNDAKFATDTHLHRRPRGLGPSGSTGRLGRGRVHRLRSRDRVHGWTRACPGSLAVLFQPIPRGGVEAPRPRAAGRSSRDGSPRLTSSAVSTDKCRSRLERRRPGSALPVTTGKVSQCPTQ